MSGYNPCDTAGDVKSSGPASASNQACQDSATGASLLGAGAGGAGIGIGGYGEGGYGYNGQCLDQATNQGLGQCADAVSANCASDNIQANTGLNYGGGNTGVY